MTTAAVIAALLSSCSSGSDAISNDDITHALATHAAAVREGDRGAFLGGVDDRSAAAAFRRAQAAEFTNLRRVPLARWTYSLSAAVRAAGPQAAARRSFGPSARIVRVTLTYAIRGVDPVATHHSLWWTFARVGGHVVICADDALDRQGGVSWRGPWDFGPMAVVSGSHSVVLGSAGDLALLHAVAGAVDDAVPAVTAVWGRRWSRYVGVIVASTPAALDAELGDDAAVAGLGPGSSASASSQESDTSAVTVSDARDPVTGQVAGLRIVVTPQAFDRLDAVGRKIVFTHEVTHVASANATGGASPRWLVEGLAEYVANLHTGLTVRAAAAELVTEIRKDGLPSTLPSDTDFDSTATSAAAYEQAWLACRLIAHQAGAAGLVRVYRAVGQSGMDTATAVSGAFRSVLHESPSAFVAAWRNYLRAEVGDT